MAIKPLVYDPPDGPIEILFQDDMLLVIEKPAGLLSVPGKDVAHRDCVQSRLLAQDPDALLVHRLDLDTSGIMVFARTKAAQRHLGLQFERRHLRKEYVAQVYGEPENATGLIDLPLIADWPNRPLQKVCHETGKSAQTRYEVLSRTPDGARVLLHPVTGRSHQLRVHLAETGTPICGDRFYGCEASRASARRLQLHASGLELRHPSDGSWQRFASAPPF